MLEVLSIVVPLYALILLGLVAGRTRTFRDLAAPLNSFVYWFALPAFLFDAVVTAPPVDGLPVSFFLVAFAVTFGLTVLVQGAATWLHSRVSARQLALSAGYGNVGYFGYPVILSILGTQAALPMALGSMVHNLLFLIGYPVIASAGNAEPGKLRHALIRSGPLNPTFISVTLALLVVLLGIPMPDVVLTPISLMAKSVIPVALFALGLALGPALATLFGGGFPVGWVVVVSVLKLIALPLLTWGAASLFLPDPTGMLTATLVLLAAMPSSVSSFTLAQEFDGDGGLVAAMVASSTLVALLTVPVFGVLVA